MKKKYNYLTEEEQKMDRDSVKMTKKYTPLFSTLFLVFAIIITLAGINYMDLRYEVLNLEHEVFELDSHILNIYENYDATYEPRLALYDGYPRNQFVNGIYTADTHFCVWTKGHENVTGTIIHEQCHDLINGNREHYCGGGTK